MTYNEAVQTVLTIARNQIGYHEKASNSYLDDKNANSGSGNYTMYARDLDAVGNFFNGPKNGYAWCDVFNDWLHYKAWGAKLAMQVLCQPERSAGAGCLYSASYYKAAGRWHTTDPWPGDQIFFSYSHGEISHTGIVESVNGNAIVTIEGNTSNMVARRSYDINDSSIVGFGRPRYELLADVPVGELAEDIPQAQVNEPAVQQPTVQQPVVQTPTVTILKKGMKSAQVKEMQEKLLKLGYDLGVDGADGEFGKNTLAAVIAFQKAHKLLADGEVGPITKTALDNAVKALGSSPQQTGDFAVGDTVLFTGGRHYVSSTGNRGYACRNGLAKITRIYRGSSVKHPFHLQAVPGGGATVNGWVDEGSFTRS